ncbi:MAG: hypothetical protein COB93_07525 [Sneathiella sp.]|nr:MAG: hypothetical protein COB93_07525 [Sneathiella sp.]
MVINRRYFLAGTAASIIASPGMALAEQNKSGFISALKTADGYAAARLDRTGQIQAIVPLPGRGHDVALSPQRTKAVIFSRRPGNFGVEWDLRTDRVTAEFASPDNRHFYGHGFFSPDGRLLYAAENNFEQERGCLGIYDAENNYQRVGEYECHGIGPHQAVLLSNQDTIALAVGGIATHPDFPRQKLNIPDMRPSLTYLDRRTGELVDQVFLPPELHQLSIRHIAEGPDKTVWFCGQFQGAATDGVNIVGFHKIGQSPELIALPTRLQRQTKYYAGSIAVNSDKSLIAVSFPRGNFMVIIDTISKALVGITESRDICGIAETGKRFYASNGLGQLIRQDGVEISQQDVLWDNHLRSF